MTLPNATLRFALLACIAVPFLTSCHAQQKSSASVSNQRATQQKIAALQGLRDSGVITDDEYQQKVAALKAPTSRSAASSPTSSAAADNHTWHLKREERSIDMTDWQTQQERPVKAVTMLLPVGWTLQVGGGPGSANLDCADAAGGLTVAAVNPEKTSGLIVLSPGTSMWSDNPGIRQQEQELMQHFKGIHCDIAQPISLAENLQQGARALFPDAQVVGQMQPVPGLSEALPGIVAGANRNGTRITAEAGRLRLSGSYKGTPFEGWLIGLSTHRTEAFAGGGSVVYQSLPLMAFVYAPPGQLDHEDKLLMTVISSVNVDQDFTRNNQLYAAMLVQKVNGAYASVNRIHQQMAEDNANAARQQQAIRNSTANYANQVHSAVAANRSAALDHSSQQFSLYMGDQAIYRDPSTGQNVQMTSQYGHVWASSTGNTNDYIMTDSASYNPNGKVGGSGWTEMEMQH